MGGTSKLVTNAPKLQAFEGEAAVDASQTMGQNVLALDLAMIMEPWINHRERLGCDRLAIWSCSFSITMVILI